jgi:signal transduction protein with GAF and PtsI domain
MSTEDKINIDIFKVVTKAIAESDSVGIMANHLAQLLVVALEIKGCTIFALNQDTRELEVLGSFGLSINYMNKGPILADKSIGAALRGEPIVVKDVSKTDRLQYPEEAKTEGIGAMVSLPIMFYGEPIGDLRLYHHEVWDISERDLDSLQLLAENIGLAMMYTRLLNALKDIKDTMDESWLTHGKRLPSALWTPSSTPREERGES